MSSNKTKVLDPGLCRCCKSIKKCRFLTIEYNWMGNREVYAELMMDTFGLLLSYVDGEANDCGVCATCVVRLRDAYAFRKQVLQCEEAFLQNKLLENCDNEINVLEEIKSEPVEIKQPKLDDDSQINYSDNDADVMDCEEPKTPLSSEPKPKAIRKTTKLIKKNHKKKLKASKLGLRYKDTLKRELMVKRSMGFKREMIVNPNLSLNVVASDQQFLSEDNIIVIIENSYAYPFKNRSNNFYCFYCKEYCAKPEDLRTHTWTHDPKKFKNIMCSKKFYYLDITKIDCRLCSNTIESINDFKTHITEAHSKKIHPNIPDRFIEFRLTFRDLNCCICKQTFFDFNAIVKHMVEHYSNFTCDVCGLCFLEENRLMIHMRSHKTEEKHPCEICGKIFKSKFYKDTHVDTVHNKIPTIRCSKCESMFLSYTQRDKHLYEAHGVHKTFPCNMCDKVYDRCKTLTEHQRRTHLKVLRHRCDYCDQRFYLPSRLREHTATHTGERNIYRCNECDKSFPRLKTLQDHVRIHSGERSCRCHVCGQDFLESISLKAHIQSLHPECDIETFF